MCSVRQNNILLSIIHSWRRTTSSLSLHVHVKAAISHCFTWNTPLAAADAIHYIAEMTYVTGWFTRPWNMTFPGWANCAAAAPISFTPAHDSRKRIARNNISTHMRAYAFNWDSRNSTIYPELCRKLNNKEDYVYLTSARPSAEQIVSANAAGVWQSIKLYGPSLGRSFTQMSIHCCTYTAAYFSAVFY